MMRHYLSFDRRLVANIGDTMYFIPGYFDEMNDTIRFINEEISIVQLKIYHISFNSDFNEIQLTGMDNDGNYYIGDQKLFFSSYEKALNAIKNPKNWEPKCVIDFFETLAPEYQYFLKFPIVPNDVLNGGLVEGIEANIWKDKASIYYKVKHGEINYQMHEYVGWKEPYKIHRL